jgi:RHS repeat-associated protein
MTTVTRFESPTMNSSIKSMWRALLCVLAPLFLLLAFAASAHAANSATFVSQSVPTSMPAGSTQTVTVTMANNGTTTWTTAGQYTLGSRNPENNLTWGGRINVPGSIAPGAQASFTFQITAPSTQGTYNFQWSMLQEFVEWFGPFTPNVAIVVTAPVNGSQVIAKSVPTSMTQGQTYPVSVTMKNTGGTTWPAGTAYNLGSTNPYDTMIWGLKRVPLNSAVAPGQQYTFSFNVVAPAPGSYTMGWGMVQEYVEWFGPTSSSPVTVGAGAQVPTISVSRTPSPMIAGQSYTLSWSSSNATSISRICTSTGTGYTVNDAPALNGPSIGTASANWVGYPSSCVWKATGTGGTATFNETMTTNAAPVSDVVTYIHTDGLGSPVARTNSSGGLVSRTRYEPYGLTASGAVPTLGFTGHVNDAATGLVYMQQRYYDPVAGRFLSIDPVTTDANTGGSFNRYAYANNSPYRYIDPDGREAQLTIGTGVMLGFQFPKVFGGKGGFLSGGLSVGVTSNAQVILQVNYTLSQGIGAFAGVGAQVQVGGTKDPTPAGVSTNETIQFDLNAGIGETAGGAVQLPKVKTGQEADIAAGKGVGGPKVGVGAGAQVSAGINTTTTIASPPLIKVPETIKEIFGD